ncbi:MAG: DUF3794 domain-containing protein [Oscillospiraceae bacterium]|nr:DUF3794 domain-containing protein [Oscillospiraceae bacterium]
MEIKTESSYPGAYELLCDTSAELPIEGEFTLPEYGEGIFRIVKTIAEPEVVQRIVSGSRATVEGYVKLTIIYVSESGGRLSSTVQRLAFSKQFELSCAADAMSEAFVNAAISYLNCRAVNERRVDVRGALTLAIKVLSRSSEGLLSEAEAPGIQLRIEETPCLRQTAFEERQFTLDETLEFDFGSAEEPRLLRVEAAPVAESVELSERRALVTGYINVKVAADVSNEGELRVKRAGFNLPFSQTLDINADTQGAKPFADISAVSCTAAVEGEKSLAFTVTCAIELRLFEQASAAYIVDAFSTEALLETESACAALMTRREELREGLTVKFTTEQPELAGELMDYFVSEAVFAPQPEEGGVKGRSTLTCIVQDELGEAVAHDFPFEFVVRTDSPAADSPYISLSAVFENTDCSLEGSRLSLRCEGIVSGSASELKRIEALKAISALEGASETRRASSLMVYYAREGEELWNIAKRFGASVEELALENAVEGERLKEAGPLLVPASGMRG